MSEPQRPSKIDEQVRRLKLLKRIASLECERNALEQANSNLIASRAIACNNQDKLRRERDTLASLVDSGDFDGARELAGEILGRGKG